MSSQTPLTGVVLVDCARANAKDGITIAAEQCGYGKNTKAFWTALQAACHEMGITDIENIFDLITDEQILPSSDGIDIAPNSSADL